MHGSWFQINASPRLRKTASFSMTRTCRALVLICSALHRAAGCNWPAIAPAAHQPPCRAPKVAKCTLVVSKRHLMSLMSPGTENVLLVQSTQRAACSCSSWMLPATRPLPDAVVTFKSERGAPTMRLTSCSAATTPTNCKRQRKRNGAARGHNLEHSAKGAYTHIYANACSWGKRL